MHYEHPELLALILLNQVHKQERAKFKSWMAKRVSEEQKNHVKPNKRPSKNKYATS